MFEPRDLKKEMIDVSVSRIFEETFALLTPVCFCCEGTRRRATARQSPRGKRSDKNRGARRTRSMQMVSRNTSYIPRPFKTRRNANPSIHRIDFHISLFFFRFRKNMKYIRRERLKKKRLESDFFSISTFVIDKIILLRNRENQDESAVVFHAVEALAERKEFGVERVVRARPRAEPSVALHKGYAR